MRSVGLYNAHNLLPCVSLVSKIIILHTGAFEVTLCSVLRNNDDILQSGGENVSYIKYTHAELIT